MATSIIWSKINEHGIFSTAEGKSTERRYIKREGGRAKLPWQTQVAFPAQHELPGAGNKCFPAKSSAPKDKNESPQRQVCENGVKGA